VNLQKYKNSFASFVLLAALFSAFQTPIAQAVTVGSNQCVQTVDTSAGVSVYQDLGFCYVAFKNATTYAWTPPATPPVTGRQSLTASITPTDISFSAATSASTAVWVNKRASSR
jgi:hypothetical protein